MKRIHYIFLLSFIGLASCKKVIDLYPESNLNTETYYSNLDEVKAGLTGAYNSLQKLIYYEWQLTELRSDNTKQGNPGSTSSNNRDLSDLDMFTPSTSHGAIYQYWLTSYNSIRNANLILQKLGVKYDPAAGSLSFQSISIPITDADRKQLAGEAMFIRAYNYFNLVRLFGGVFLNYEPLTPEQAKTMNRVSAAEIYKLIEADLKTAAVNMNTLKFNQIAGADLGRANGWAAKGLLAKVYLTQNKKSEAITLLNDVKNNSGYALLTGANAYANVFSTTNEMNSEIIFAIRFKAGGLGLGNLLPNVFAPLSSGSAVIAGDGDGLNYPTNDLDTVSMGDPRRATNIGVFGTGSAAKLYVKKFIPPQPSVNDDTENDWLVLRYADILLMLAEAQGFSQPSIDLINGVRTRAGAMAYAAGALSTVAQFEQALSTERRIEFSFENQRWFDLVRFNTTLTTITAEQAMKDHFAREYYNHYRQYTAPALTLAQLQSNVTKEHLLLPIPQREIDTNTSLVIPQNPGY
ncbi:RagB/SusD family nutrient uptake outer membrane protein [Flavisolibacter ginsenosidimutans]|uniref:RagB/SusD family nutrient uptake outer membrane protein n=1 Tax=Flavisolibacter ginsenosidimutans TaxID=661481 RepID=A0A5B8UH27_9BACT|nr:RagB/SusD family nutrient uptake outer membrane protein [Flavisolibacter ginsenosidimutans]QEC55798.1 RagB/SusD family nutrient uptake outer membrane protein [Flavisolibacter ginsenosidimutans]